MTIQKPYSISIKNMVIDANNSFLLSWKSSGNTSSSFSIDIFKNSDSTLAYSLPRTYSLATSYTIPARFVPNGQDYKMKVTVWDANSNTASSDYVIFTASTSPVITVDAIPTVTNHAYLFTAHYSQPENVTLQSYTVNLYDSNKALLNTSGVMTDGLVQYLFDLMKSGLTYYVEFVLTSSKGLTTSSGLISFNVQYDNPYLYMNLQGENIPDSAGIHLSWQVIQVIGKTTVAPTYLNNDEIDLRNGKVFFDEGFDIANNFTLKLWFRTILPNIDLIYLKGTNGVIRVQFQNDNRFHMYKEINGFTSHFATPELEGGVGYFISPYQYVIDNKVVNSFFLGIQQNNGQMDLYNEVQYSSVGNTLNGLTFDQTIGETFDSLTNKTFS